MARFEIFFNATSESMLKKLPKKEVARILTTVGELSSNPYPPGCRKLAGTEKSYRIRIGHFRVIYEIEHQKLMILVLKIGHRRDVYK
ncbi:MAG: type II toxin-antitoxin system RelE/ParE family toxin [Deltaproteobacteria bacterium]|nr:type II toxin-antitoxin system RelE/ParE family toxin [Deltaproteobacteria bacterium]